MRLLMAAILILTAAGCETAPETRRAALQAPAKTAPAAYPSRHESFIWPVSGTAVYRNKGLDIKSAEGTVVLASRSGRVVFLDPAMSGFGKTVILDHGGGYQSVYAYNSEILVKPGDEIAQGKAVARVGRSGRAAEPTLHFEIRKDGEPVDPRIHLGR